MKKEPLYARAPVIEPLSLRPADAARAIGISERLLWQWTREQFVPHVRIGNVVLYPVEQLGCWLKERTTRIKADNNQCGSAAVAAGEAEAIERKTITERGHG
jgi:hypothetical protein